MYDWIVIGGGIHGCTVASFLLKRGKVAVEKLRIIDPYDEPMSRWKKNTELIGMEYLRSPFVHHIDVDPFSLQKFVRKHKRDSKEFYGKYKRPALRLFNEHSESILKEVDLKRSWKQGFVYSIEKEQGYWNVMTEKGEVFKAKNIVLSISINDQLNIPDWAKQLKSEMPDKVFHIFEENFINLSSKVPSIAVIGGGITAAHLTIKLSTMFPGKVTLVKRHEERRNIIQQARYKGSLPKELFHKLNRLEKENKITTVNGEVESTFSSNDNEITLKIEDKEVKVNNILLATGFLSSRPGKDWLNKLIEDQNLSCAKCGYPIIDKTLQWCSNLYISGPLAELEMGPIARNISGARQAAERIVNSL